MNQLSSIQQFILAIVPVLFAITLHEVAHGWVALRLGDKTALMMGRLTINPINHIDPIGTILVPILTYSLGGFILGWAKPVPVTWEKLRNPKRDMAWVALAGPAANLFMTLFWVLIAKLGFILQSKYAYTAVILIYMGKIGIIINLLLMILNLIPIPPLDGSRVVSSILPKRLAYQYNRLEIVGFIILVILLLTGALGKIIFPLLQILLQWLAYLFNLPLTSL